MLREPVGAVEPVPPPPPLPTFAISADGSFISRFFFRTPTGTHFHSFLRRISHPNSRPAELQGVGRGRARFDTYGGCVYAGLRAAGAGLQRSVRVCVGSAVTVASA